jgi:Flp pilus assembly protein CpaB
MLFLYLALYYVKSYTYTGCGLAPQEPETVVVVPRHDLMPGHTIEADDLMLAETWRATLDDRALRSADQAVGRVPVERILAGEFLREERLADPEAGVGMRAVIPEGTVAIEVPIGISSATLGDPVDLLITGTQTETWLEDQKIVALKHEPELLAVLAVPSAEAERVRQALKEGVPTLVVRPPPHQSHGPPGLSLWGPIRLSQMGR